MNSRQQKKRDKQEEEAVKKKGRRDPVRGKSEGGGIIETQKHKRGEKRKKGEEQHTAVIGREFTSGQNLRRQTVS